VSLGSDKTTLRLVHEGWLHGRLPGSVSGGDSEEGREGTSVWMKGGIRDPVARGS
jgi:hypothetical protein